MNQYGRRSIALAIALSTVAGYVDGVGFVATGKYFVSFMSGTTTRLGASIAEGDVQTALVALGIVGLFVSGVVAGSFIGRAAGQRRKPVIIASVAALLSLAAIFSWQQFLPGVITCLVFAMGIENTVFQRDGEVAIGLTYMTGTLVRMGQRIASAVSGGPKWEWTRYGMLWLGLTTGAVSGAISITLWGSTAAIAIAAAVVWALALASVRLVSPKERHLAP